VAIGKSIRIYLPSGSINGIRHAEIVNWTGQAISCPRNLFKGLKDWPEATKPGIYFLFGVDDDGHNQVAYIGEAENVHERLKNHITNKDFWNEVVFFTSKDENLTKSHVKYLESILITKAIEVARYELQNSVSPNSPTLPMADRDAMTEFSENVRTLLGALGHKLLEPYTLLTKDDAGGQVVADKLRLLNKNTYGSRVSDGFLVYAGSEMAVKQAESLTEGKMALRQQLIDDEIVQLVGNVYKLQKDWLFNSPSAAADTLHGYPTNGLDAWKGADGKSLKELETV